MRTWVKCKYIKEITPQMKFLFQLYKNPKDNKDLIKALTKQINYCDNKVYSSLIHNKDRIFNNGKYFVMLNDTNYYGVYTDISKTKGVLTNIRIMAFEKIYNYRNNYESISFKTDKSYLLKNTSILSEGTYRLYKNEIYKLCNKT